MRKLPMNAMCMGLLFVSGLTGLVYEVLWMRQLGLLFGNTSHAAAATFAALFAGMAAGNAFWGRRVSRVSRPLRLYAWLQVGIAASAVSYFAILRGYENLYPWLYQTVGSPVWLLVAKFALAMLLVFPPAFFMGGTVPAMGQHRVEDLSRFGTTSALLYGVNTLGGALGAGLAGFYLPLRFGFRSTLLGTMALTGLVALVAFAISRRATSVSGVRCTEIRPPRGEQQVSPCPSAPRTLSPVSRAVRWSVSTVCFLSGFGVLALEVLWMRMFSQVLENSVYTYSAILVTVLLCLAMGALLSSRLARLAVAPQKVLATLLLVGGLSVAVTPFLFMYLTDSLRIVASRATWPGYVGLIFLRSFQAIGVPAVLLGTVFPFLMKVEELRASSAGRSLGRLAAINTTGAILGSVLCGFVFLGTFGMWRTMQLLAGLYLFAAVALPVGRSGEQATARKTVADGGALALRLVAALALTLLFAVFDPASLPISSVDPLRPEEKILETWEGSDSTVAVARSQYGISIKVNSHYGLGSTGATVQQKMQSDIPLMVYPLTGSIFYLGMGTGITAGSALDPQFKQVTRVVACELMPEVVDAARKYIANDEGQDHTGGLFTDPRARILVEDGRHYLMATRDRYDMINSDLFVPFRSGAGSLYSREHFQAVRERLEPGGVFFQWLPLYQLTETEFSIIVKTMLETFDQVTLWRSNFQPGEEVVALAGHREPGPLPACSPSDLADRRAAVEGRNHRDLDRLLLPFNPQTILFFYCGNLTEAKALFANYPVNTDDRPYIEYLAPRTYRNVRDTTIPWYVGPRLARLVDELQRICPPDRDPVLAGRATHDLRLPLAGAAYHWARIWEVIGDERECAVAWQRFVTTWTGADEPRERSDQ